MVGTVRVVIGGLWVCAALASSGCGYLFGDEGVFRDKTEDYKRAPESPVITVPEGLSDAALQEVYVVPEVEDSLVLAGDFEVPRPTPLISGASDDLVRIQKLGDDNWALVSVAPGQLWPQVRSFLAATGMQVARVDARAGIMETGWLELTDQPMASRFRFRIEQGVQRGNSELHVLQMNQAGDVNSWPEKSDNLPLESEMLQGVAQYIANSAESSPVSMIADQAISASGKISLQEGEDGKTYIRLGLPFTRAWASVARALPASTFEVTDRDRSKGLYYARFLGPDGEEEEGWFDWMFDEDEHPLAGRDYLVSVRKESDTSVAIAIEAAAGTAPLDIRERQALLALIKGNIN